MDPLINPVGIGWYRTGHLLDRRMQRGTGIGSFFGKIIPFIKKAISYILPAAKKVASHPAVKKTARDLRDHAIESGIDITSSAIKGENVKEKLKQKLSKAGDIVIDNAGNAVKNRKRSGALEVEPPGKKKKKKKKVKRASYPKISSRTKQKLFKS